MENRKPGEWMWDLLENVSPEGEGTDYIGNDLRTACIVSQITRNPVWEHKDRPGYFVVARVPVINLGMSGWIEYKMPQ